MKTVLRIVRPLTASLVSIAVVVASVMFAGPAAHASDKPIRIGLVTFLSGPAAGPFGVPARIAAEAIVESLNAGEVPPPYGSIGFSGVPIELVIIDEAGGATKQVAEFRNLVERQKVDFVIGYISSGDCLAIPPVAEELLIAEHPACSRKHPTSTFFARAHMPPWMPLPVRATCSTPIPT
jgi:branched-chain amino acid transport system substrate-binding protein